MYDGKLTVEGYDVQPVAMALADQKSNPVATAAVQLTYRVNAAGGGDGGQSGGQTGGTGSTGAATPPTGDNSGLTFWLALAPLAVALAWTTRRRRSR